MQVNRRAYYQRVYWGKFVALYASLEAEFSDSYGRKISIRNPSEMTDCLCIPEKSFIYRPREVRWVVGYSRLFKLSQFAHVTGLVCLIEFGGPSRLHLDITHTHGQCRLNGVPLTALHMRRKRQGWGNRYWTTRLYFQIDCRAEIALLDAVRMVKRLWRRNRKSYFSWLPKELIVYIQTLVLA